MGSIDSESVKQTYSHPLISERSIDDPSPLKVIYVGAGISGIVAAIQFPRYIPDIDLVIYDKNADVGGTWFENKYPGCACDIPAHSYQLSFESSLEWTKFYASAPEILKYWQRVVDKYKLRKYMRFQYECIEARWNEQSCKWHVKFRQVETGKVIEDVADVFIAGTGVLNQWKWPDIKGLKDFKGPLLHSANWDSSFEAKNKNVAVIGAGSSGIQIVPTLQPQVSHMDHYVRGRTWISATFGNELVRERNDGHDGNFTYTEEEKENWRRNPASYLNYRKAIEVGMQGGYAITHRNTQEHTAAWSEFEQDMRRRLKKKPAVADHIIPEFEPLCRRLTPGPGYLEALTASNVDVIHEQLSHIDATGITTKDGKHRPVDAIICATGFDTSYQNRFPIYGRGQQNLRDRYRSRAETYLSVTTDGFPNYFQSVGPNSGLGNGNFLLVIEAIQLYIAQILQKLSIDNVATIEPKPEVVQNFTNYCDQHFKRTVFSAECNSWYKSSPPGTSPEEQRRGRITALWPGSSLHAAKALERPRYEDFVLTYRDDNPIGWLGDGWTRAEKVNRVHNTMANKDDIDKEEMAETRLGLCWYLDGGNFLHEDLNKADRGALQKGSATGVGQFEESKDKSRRLSSHGVVENGHVTAGEKVPGSILSV